MRKEARIYQRYRTFESCSSSDVIYRETLIIFFPTLAQPVSGTHSAVFSLRLVAFGEMGLMPMHMNKAYDALHKTSLVTRVWESKKRFNNALLQLQFCKLGTWASRRQYQRGEQITFTNKKVINTNQHNLFVLLHLHNELNPLCSCWFYLLLVGLCDLFGLAAIANRDGETLNPRFSLMCPRLINENFLFRFRQSSTSFKKSSNMQR